jgi:hypothetical protein
MGSPDHARAVATYALFFALYQGSSGAGALQAQESCAPNRGRVTTTYRLLPPDSAARVLSERQIPSARSEYHPAMQDTSVEAYRMNPLAGDKASLSRFFPLVSENKKLLVTDESGWATCVSIIQGSQNNLAKHPLFSEFRYSQRNAWDGTVLKHLKDHYYPNDLHGFLVMLERNFQMDPRHVVINYAAPGIIHDVDYDQPQNMRGEKLWRTGPNRKVLPKGNPLEGHYLWLEKEVVKIPLDVYLRAVERTAPGYNTADTLVVTTPMLIEKKVLIEPPEPFVEPAQPHFPAGLAFVLGANWNLDRGLFLDEFNYNANARILPSAGLEGTIRLGETPLGFRMSALLSGAYGLAGKTESFNDHAGFSGDAVAVVDGLVLATGLGLSYDLNQRIRVAAEAGMISQGGKITSSVKQILSDGSIDPFSPSSERYRAEWFTNRYLRLLLEVNLGRIPLMGGNALLGFDLGSSSGSHGEQVNAQAGMSFKITTLQH